MMDDERGPGNRDGTEDENGTGSIDGDAAGIPCPLCGTPIVEDDGSDAPSVKCPGCSQEYPTAFLRDAFLEDVARTLRSRGFADPAWSLREPAAGTGNLTHQRLADPESRDPLNTRAPARVFARDVLSGRSLEPAPEFLGRTAHGEEAEADAEVPVRKHRELLMGREGAAPRGPDAKAPGGHLRGTEVAGGDGDAPGNGERRREAGRKGRHTSTL